jgi:hypothetical protein
MATPVVAVAAARAPAPATHNHGGLFALFAGAMATLAAGLAVFGVLRRRRRQTA